MSMTKTPADEEVTGSGAKKRTAGTILRAAGQRLARSRILVKLGEMADRGAFDEYTGGERRIASMCRPH